MQRIHYFSHCISTFPIYLALYWVPTTDLSWYFTTLVRLDTWWTHSLNISRKEFLMPFQVIYNTFKMDLPYTQTVFWLWIHIAFVKNIRKTCSLLISPSSFSDFIPPLKNRSQYMTCTSVLQQNGAVIRMPAVRSSRRESRLPYKDGMWQDSPYGNLSPFGKFGKIPHMETFQVPFVETMNSLADEVFPLFHTAKENFQGLLHLPCSGLCC